MARDLTKIALIGLFSAGLALSASAEICRSLSSSWTQNSADYRTQLWTSGVDGCKKIEHTVTIAGVERKIEGLDCDCDLKADGEESSIQGAPHPLNVAKMSDLCRGPMSDPAETATHQNMSRAARSDIIS